MLREFFAREGNIGVRHRFFPNEAGLEKWCRELMYLAEPTVLAIATHGTQEGLVAHGQPIAPRVLVENLVWAENLLLVHFSACLMLHDSPAGEAARKLQKLQRFPVSASLKGDEAADPVFQQGGNTLTVKECVVASVQ